MVYHADIGSRFTAAFERDKDAFIEDWMVSWAYQAQLKKLRVKYADSLPQEFHEYKGPAELIKWFNWCREASLPDYFDTGAIEELIELSYRFDKDLSQAYSLEWDMSDYAKTIGRYNAQDYLFQNLYPVPERYVARRILDFGAGYGRQANVWTQKHKDLVYVGLDGIPLSYCLQHLYYSHVSTPVHDYVVDPLAFEISETPGVYHLPTWRCDLLPAAFFDLVLCVQVLPEINSRLLRFMVRQFHRILKPGGALYIRDHDAWRAHNINLNSHLTESGFELEFRPHVAEGRDVHGVPRVWRKKDPAVVASRDDRPAHSRLALAIADIDGRFDGRLSRAFRSVVKKK